MAERRYALIGHREPYGEIYVRDNTTNTTLNSAAEVQVVNFTTNGQSFRTTPDYTNSHITIIEGGTYLALAAIAVVNVAAQAQKIHVELSKNNNAATFNNIHADRGLAAGGGDTGSMSLAGLISVSAGDTIELWAHTDTAADRVVLFSDVTLTILKVG